MVKNGGALKVVRSVAKLRGNALQRRKIKLWKEHRYVVRGFQSRTSEETVLPVSFFKWQSMPSLYSLFQYTGTVQ